MHRALLATVALAFAADAAAGPSQAPVPIQPVKPVPSGAPSIPPPPRVQLAAYIASVRHTPTPGAPAAAKLYSHGSISFDVEIANPTANALSTKLVVARLGAGTTATEVARAAVSVPAGEHAWITVVDTLGLKNVCAIARDRLTLETGDSKTMQMTPTCKFTADAVDPMATMVPEQQLEAMRDRVTYVAAQLTTTSLACGRPLAMKATVRNLAKSTANEVRLRIDGPRTAATDAFELGPNKERIVTASIPAFAGEAGTYMLKIDSGSGAHVFQPEFQAQVARACSIEIALER